MATKKPYLYIIALLLLSLLVSGCGAPAKTKSSINNLDFPTDLAFAPDGSLFFTEKGGALKVVQPGRTEPELVASFKVPSVISYDETGLLGVALSPDFSEDRTAFVYHTFRNDSGMGNRIVRINVDRPKARQVIFDDIIASRIHNGGKLQFGPDGLLYVATGDAGQSERSQDRLSGNGKILRIKPDGSIPTDNPFPGSAAYAIGLRNVFGIAFDDQGRLVATENGPNGNDEINQIVRGANYGWPKETGDTNGQFADPLAVFADAIAPTGIAFLKDRFVFGSWNDGHLRSVALGPRHAKVQSLVELNEGITAVAVSPSGALYVATADTIHLVELP